MQQFNFRPEILLPERTEEEYSACEIRKILQELFPHRRLVLSQFTFFNQIGVSRPTGETSRRGRQCYRLQDVLSIACVLALKEEGIPLKTREDIPVLIQENAEQIFELGEGCKLSGFGSCISLALKGETFPSAALEEFLCSDMQAKLFWSFDVGQLATKLAQIAKAQGAFFEKQQVAA